MKQFPWTLPGFVPHFDSRVHEPEDAVSPLWLRNVGGNHDPSHKVALHACQFEACWTCRTKSGPAGLVQTAEVSGNGCAHPWYYSGCLVKTPKSWAVGGNWVSIEKQEHCHANAFAAATTAAHRAAKRKNIIKPIKNLQMNRYSGARNVLTRAKLERTPDSPTLFGNPKNVLTCHADAKPKFIKYPQVNTLA